MKIFHLRTVANVFYEFSVDTTLEEKETGKGEVPCKNYYEKHNLKLT